MSSIILGTGVDGDNIPMSTFGPAFDKQLDGKRINQQMARIRDIMFSAHCCDTWLTLYEIHAMTHYPESSISAQLRHLRKKEFGSYRVEKRRRGHGKDGLWEYRVFPPLPAVQEKLFA